MMYKGYIRYIRYIRYAHYGNSVSNIPTNETLLEVIDKLNAASV